MHAVVAHEAVVQAVGVRAEKPQAVHAAGRRRAAPAHGMDPRVVVRGVQVHVADQAPVLRADVRHRRAVLRGDPRPARDRAVVRNRPAAEVRARLRYQCQQIGKTFDLRTGPIILGIGPIVIQLPRVADHYR